MRRPKCGMGYIPGLIEDEAALAQYCDLIVNGPATTVGYEQEKVVWANADDENTSRDRLFHRSAKETGP